MLLCLRPEMYGIRPESLAIYARQPIDWTVPLGDMVEVGELRNVYGQSLWANRLGTGQDSSLYALNSENRFGLHSRMTLLSQLSLFSLDLKLFNKGLMRPIRIREMT